MTFSEVRQALRTLWVRQNRGYTAASVLMLGIGIGAVTTIFSVLYAVLLAPLPYREPDSVVALAETKPSSGLDFFSVSALNYVSWTERVKGYDGLAGYVGGNANIQGQDRIERVESVQVTPNFWQVLGLPLLAGRTFSANENLVNPNAVIVSEALWRGRFGSDPQLVGKSLQVDGAPLTVIGIAPSDAGFTRTALIWLPLAPREQPWGRGDRRLGVFARLAPGVSREAADAELRAIQVDLAREFPEDNTDWSSASQAVRDYIVGAPLRERVLVLAGAVLLLILVVCLNVANLQLARATAREREIGVRQALGATRARLIRQIVAECLMLAALGGAFGIALAAFALRVAAHELAGRVPQLDALALDWRVAGFALALAALTAVACGLAPALLAARSRATAALAGAGRSPSDTRRTPVRQALVVLQFALATLLVVASSLLVQQFQAMQAKRLGFTPERVLSARVTMPDDDNGTNYNRNSAAYQRLLDAVRELPGVERAGLGSEVPLGQLNTTSMCIAAGTSVNEARTAGVVASWRVVSSDFLEALGVPVMRGRAFAASGERSHSMLLSEGLVRRLWPGGDDAVGRKVTLSNGQAYDVIGVVGDVRQLERGGDPTPTMYMSPSWSMLSTMSLVLKTRVDPERTIAEVRAVAARVVPEFPLFEIRPMQSVISENVAQPRAQAAMVALFGAVSLLLAALGVAGVTAYAVARRTPELAVRMALGASPRRVVRYVMARGWVMCGAGIALGSLLVAVGTELTGTLVSLPDVRVLPTLALATLLLGAVGLMACWLPARRATRISPSLTLRGE